ncbi:hypothetical protein [Microbacterium sp. NPDC077486]|uniref:hypothetical protein n=1 Tax=Microbacterium sp. NPDC077486 TaxID=3154766 RepID=UPI003412EBC8
MSDSWTEADDAELAHYALPEGHPAAVVAQLVRLLRQTPLPVSELNDLIRVPGSWGDFSDAAAFVADLAIGSRTRRHKDDPGVVYVSLVEDEGSKVYAQALPPKALVTLVWHEGAWRPLLLGAPASGQVAAPYVSGAGPMYDTDVLFEWSDEVKIVMVGPGGTYHRAIDKVDPAVPLYRVLGPSRREVYHYQGRQQDGMPVYEYVGTDERQMPDVGGSH